ncbi:type III secretion system protein PrgN [Enterococcus sp. AZ101]|uniref:type III secretion system protein PrgN n=1 Tax=Enterococcus sp. AZ101 TaxID=2774742 RepID=UPI003D289587
MKTNTYVYPHPINTFIIKQLGVTVDQFCELHGYPQSTVATWITRNRSVENLPASFIYSLSLAASKSMDVVYSDLLLLQDDYKQHLHDHRRTKKRIDG